MIWMIVLVVLMIPILAILLDSQLGQALASRLERRGLGEGDTHMAERMAYLEGEVERMSEELLRLDEESRFMTRLLSERAEGEDAPRALPEADAPGRDAGGGAG
jgi:hypothetical protein